MTQVYIRKLQHGDHLTSYKWRNNPKVWTYTGSRPNMVVTEQVEEEWINKVLQDTTTLRFAICICGTDEYIGNTHFTDINDGSAEFHIFIGAVEHWGKGFGYPATKLALEEGFRSGLREIYMFVNSQNHSVIRNCGKAGFKTVEENGDLLKMTLSLKNED